MATTIFRGRVSDIMDSDKQGAGEPVTLTPRDQPNPVVSILKKIGLRSLAWVGVYLLGYFDFSVAWMVTPLLLSVLRSVIFIMMSWRHQCYISEINGKRRRGTN